MKTTKFAKKEEIIRKWYLVDAKDVVLGRMATELLITLGVRTRLFLRRMSILEIL